MLFIFENLVHVSKYLCKIILLGFIFFFSNVAAQEPHPAFKQYDVEAGLASSKVYQVKQDSKGYMWFATDNGVSRFNGYEFEHFSVSDGLPDNTVFEIFEDKKGRVWFLTLTNKLFYYDHYKMHLYKYNKVIDEIKGEYIKTSFCITENGSVFLGLYGYGIIEITEQGKLKRASENDTSKPYISVIEPTFGSLIYGYNNLTRDKNSIGYDTRFLKGKHIISSNIHNLQPTARFIRLKNNKILFSCENLLHIIDDLNTFRIEKFNERINWLYEDRDRDLWVGTYLGGVYHIENGDFKHKKNYLKDLFVTGVTQDAQGGFWFTTEGNSVYYTPSKKILTYDQASGLKDARITCLASDTEGIYLGLPRPLIHKITYSGNIRSYNCPAGHTAISSFYYDHKISGLWFSGSAMSGCMINDKYFNSYNISFSKLLRGSNTSYWLINSNGLHKLVPQKTTRYFLKAKRMNGILKKSDETLLMGAMDGLWEYNIPGNSIKHLYAGNSLMRNRILDLVYTNDSILLMATKGAGLLMLSKDGKVRQINHTNGLSSDNVYKILTDGQVVWLATDKGLNRLIKSKQGFWRIKVFTTYDGLISNEINDIHKFNHKIWVATDKGLSFFESTLKNDLSFEMPVYIHKIVVNDSSKTIRHTYRLAYFENNIKINFLGLEYKNTGKLYYRYRMEGLDTNWVYTKNRETQYTTLPPGNYKFTVSVLNANGNWSKHVAKVEFMILTPFWKTWWFFAFSIAALIYVIFYIVRYQLKRTQEQEDKNDELNRVLLNLKLKALRAQMNPHFTFNVMNSIQHFILYKNDEAAHRYLSKFSRLIRAILNNSEKNTVPIADEIKALELYLDLESMRFEHQFEYEIIIDEAIDVNKMEIPSMLIQPYVENSIKHGILQSSKQGKIKIEIIKYQNFFKCVIEDNGIGRVKSSENNKNVEHRSFGTSITKERLSVINELYKSRLTELIIDMEDENGNPNGTKVEIYIPIAFTDSV